MIIADNKSLYEYFTEMLHNTILQIIQKIVKIFI